MTGRKVHGNCTSAPLSHPQFESKCFDGVVTTTLPSVLCAFKTPEQYLLTMFRCGGECGSLTAAIPVVRMTSLGTMFSNVEKSPKPASVLLTLHGGFASILPVCKILPVCQEIGHQGCIPGNIGCWERLDLTEFGNCACESGRADRESFLLYHFLVAVAMAVVSGGYPHPDSAGFDFAVACTCRGRSQPIWGRLAYPR
jgi:hypothetical protein